MEERKFQVIETCVRSAFLEWLIQSDTTSALQEILCSVKNDADYSSVTSPIQSPRAEPLPLMTSPIILDKISSGQSSVAGSLAGPIGPDLYPPPLESPSVDSMTVDLSARSSKSVCKPTETPTDIPSSGTSVEIIPTIDKCESSSITDAEADIQSFFEPPSFYENANRGFDDESSQVLRNVMSRSAVDRGGGDISDSLTIDHKTFEEVVVQKIWGLSQYMAVTLWCLITDTPFENVQKLLANGTGTLRRLTYDEVADFWAKRHLSLVDSLERGSDWNFYVCLLDQAAVLELPQDLGIWPKIARLPVVGRLNVLSACIREVVCRHPSVDFLRAYTDFQNNFCETVLRKCIHDLMSGVKKGLASSWLDSSEAGAPKDLTPSDDFTFEFEDLAYTTLNKKWHQVRYEEFYVVYCMFLNLDSSRKSALDRQDLIKYNHWAMSNFLITRIFQEGSFPITTTSSGCRSPIAGGLSNADCGAQMRYGGFFWFVMLDEDKTTDESIEFWFRILDLDGDGYIQKYEIERFYLDQQARLISRNMDAPPLDVVFCQIADMIRAENPYKITVRDIKRQRRNAPMFFNTLLSLTKFLLWEHRDPFASKAEILEYPLLTEFDRWSRIEYERLATDDRQRDETSETLEVSGGAAY